MFRALIPSFALVLLAAASPATGAVSVGHSGWFWGNPTPQGNSLHAIEFAGSTGYAAGDFGTLVRTTDGGANWTGLSTGVTATLHKLEVIDGDSVVVGGTCVVRRTDDAGGSFRRLPFTSSEARCSRRLADFSFPDANIGYLVLENGTLLATGDGGRSFSPRAPIPGTRQAGGPAEPTSILFISAERGFATTTAGQLYRTTDGGAEWTQVFAAGSVLHDVLLAGSSGVVVGDSGVFATTTDGGDTWKRELGSPTYGLGIDLLSVRCAGAVCLMGTRGAGIVRTTDGGRSFQLTEPEATVADFVAATRAVAVGPAGTTFVSTNAGEDFTELSRRLNVTAFGRLRATSALVAHAPGSRGALARTTDGGQTWVNVGVATSEAVLDSSFPTSASGFALDVEGGLFRTENGGGSWGILDTGTAGRPRAVLAPDASVVLLVGPTGLRRSIDGGDSFTAVRDGDVRRASLDDADRAGASVAVFGRRKIAVSTNRGRTWRTVPLPRTRRSVAHADFVSSKTGYALMNDGRVFSTRNGGRSWTELPAVGNATGTQLAFGDSKNGWLAIGNFELDGAYVLRTTNGGASWRPQLLADGAVGSIAAGSAVAGFAHVATGPNPTNLMATGTGGDAGAGTELSLAASKRRLRRPRRVEIRGKLSPARGGEQIVVGIRRRDRISWSHDVETATRDGSFSIERRISRTTIFVAQWRGDEESNGAASRALTVRVVR